MKIRKYQGNNETEAMIKVKEELGKDALIVSIKNVRPKGFYKLFKKPYVEVTAALDDRNMEEEKKEKQINNNDNNRININKDNYTYSKIENREKNDISYIERAQQLIENISKASPELIDGKREPKENNINIDSNKGKEIYIDNEIKTEDREEPVIKVIYEQLIENEINEEVANYLTNGLAELVVNNNGNIDDIISIIYKRIVNILADTEPIKFKNDTANTIMFVGPTGVGKTTTIAKIASYFTLNLNKKVALITADTYRIAAVEQLRTYANILNIPIKVVYTAQELNEAIGFFKEKDIILVDTAGRSFNNNEHQDEIVELVNKIKEKEVFLVLSLTTKYKDLVSITKAYERIPEYKIVFTKLDETSSYGNILNIKRKTGVKLSYVTFGQNVPDDISELNPHVIAKKILGGNE